jgi:hypothetical protein
LAKRQEDHAKNLKDNADESKISSSLEQVKFQERVLLKARNRITEEESQIHIKQNELSNLKKQYAQKLSEREKIRHNEIKSDF